VLQQKAGQEKKQKQKTTTTTTKNKQTNKQKQGQASEQQFPVVLLTFECYENFLKFRSEKQLTHVLKDQDPFQVENHQ